MSADEHLGPQFTEVYHASDWAGVKRAASGKAPSVFVSTHDSPYLEEFGPARLKLRVPRSRLVPDPAESFERMAPGIGHLFMPGEHHYEISGEIRPGDVSGMYQGKVPARYEKYQ